jgi:hypothetical protein
MPYNTIRDPGMARGFSILSDILSPDPQRLIQADLAARQRDKLMVDTDLQRTALDRARAEAKAQADLTALLAGNPDLADPANRARLMSILSGVDNGLQYGPKFATGAATYINPNAFGNPNDLSTAMLGTGTVNSWADTPTGFQTNQDNLMERQRMANETDIRRQGMSDDAAWRRNEASLANALTREQMSNDAGIRRQGMSDETDLRRQGLADDAANRRNEASLANALTREQVSNDAAMARTIYQTENPGPGNRAPLDVSPQDSIQAWKLIEQRLAEQFPDAVVDPSVKGAIMPLVMAEYQRTRNIELSIQTVLGQIGQGQVLEQYQQDDSWLPTGDTTHVRAKTSPSAPPAGADGSAPAGAPTAGAGPVPTATGPNGEKIKFVNGQWVPVQ